MTKPTALPARVRPFLLNGGLAIAALVALLVALPAAAAAAAPHVSAHRVALGSPYVKWTGMQRGKALSGVVRGKRCRVKVARSTNVERVRFFLTASHRHGRRVTRVRLATHRGRAGAFTCSLDTHSVPDGPITITATATGESGAEESVSREFVVSNSSESAAAGKPAAKAGSGTWFAASSVWNRALGASVPLAPNSAGYVSELVRQVSSAGPWINTDQYSTPVYTVGAAQPTVKVKIVREDGGWVDPDLEAAFSAVPLPANAQPAAGSDGHLVVWQPSSDEMWEFWRLRKEGGGWAASHGGAMKKVSTNPGYYDANAWSGAKTWWGATATSLPLVGGLMTIDELRERRIEHALAMAIPEPSPSYVWPAQRSDGWSRNANAIPEGTIFRLPASLDLNSLNLPPLVLAIATAAQRYGMVVRDVSGCVCLYGEDPTPAGGNPYSGIFEGQYPNGLLKQFPWSKLVAIAPGN